MFDIPGNRGVPRRQLCVDSSLASAAHVLWGETLRQEVCPAEQRGDAQDQRRKDGNGLTRKNHTDFVEVTRCEWLSLLKPLFDLLCLFFPSHCFR